MHFSDSRFIHHASSARACREKKKQCRYGREESAGRRKGELICWTVGQIGESYILRSDTRSGTNTVGVLFPITPGHDRNISGVVIADLN